MEKIKRNDLIRQQPSLGDQLINIGVKEGVGLIGKLLDRGDKNKALAVILEKLDRIEAQHRIILESCSDQGIRLLSIENRLKEIEEKLNKE